MYTPTRIHLTPEMFSPQEKIMVEYGKMVVYSFIYPSGVHGLRLTNARGEIVVLPYQGQQIWSAHFDDRDLTMRSMFDQPHPTQNYLSNYGGFVLHCGFTAMGVPTKEDDHPLHGELPNAPYEDVILEIGEDSNGMYIQVGGKYHHTVAFNYNYLAEPIIRLHETLAQIQIEMECTNIKHSPMNFMYLAHVNFRPVDNSELIYSAHCNPENVRVRTSIPSHVHPMPGYKEFIAELQSHPELHNRLSPDLKFDPEIVFFIDYQTDRDGWAHSMQVHPVGTADYIRHRPDQLDKGIRWICRTADQDALGIVLPATAEPEGFHAEERKGNLKVLPPGGKFQFAIEIGSLTPDEVHLKKELIASILNQR